MDINKFIEELNQRENIPDIRIASLESSSLTEEEMTFFDTYKPEKVLIVYGSLAPGKPNHSVVEHIKGKWQQGIIRGKLETIGWGAALGYNGFSPARSEEGEPIKAHVLFSTELLANWPMLDEFEGKEYRRILAKYELDNGEVGVGYIYAINEEYRHIR